jgi:hypothetical protein
VKSEQAVLPNPCLEEEEEEEEEDILIFRFFYMQWEDKRFWTE